MKKILLAVLILISAASSGTLALDVMPADQIEPGMEGTGYSVFKGAEPEAFGATIIGVVKNWKADRDLIIAELRDADLETSGIIAGMSGSPVYIEGKLIGAVAYAWPWSKKPIAGITPIEEMIELWEDMDRQDNMDIETGSLPYSTDDNTVVAHFSPYGDMELKPIATPLFLSGMSDETTEFMKDELSRFGLAPVQGGGGGEGQPLPGEDDLGPGHVIACPLITGDFKAAAIGTVTAREGDRIVAFGHSFLNKGIVSIPMSGGAITTVMPLQTVSFKMGRPGRIIGSIDRDHLQAIAGMIGGTADLFPVTIDIDDPDLARNREYNIRIAQVDELAPMLLVSALGQAVSQISGGAGDVSVSYTLNCSFEDYDRNLRLSGMFYSSMGFFSLYPSMPILTLLDYPDRKTRISEVRADIRVVHENRTATIEGFTTDRDIYQPGDTVVAQIRMRAFNREEIFKKVEFEIPADAQPGDYTIQIEGGMSISGKPTMAQISSFDQLFDELLEWIPENSVVVRLVYPEQSIGLEGREVQGLPPSMKDAIVKSTVQNLTTFDRYERAVFKSDRVVGGSVSAIITIQKEY